MMGDQRPLAEQQIRALNAQRDRLHTGKLSRSSQSELRMRITQRISSKYHCLDLSFSLSNLSGVGQLSNPYFYQPPMFLMCSLG